MLSNEEKTFLYTGPSMFPTFHPGDELQLQDCDLASPHRGDVVVFTQTKSDKPITVVHRIMKLRHGKLYTRGDSNLHLDPEPLVADTFLGIVVSRLRVSHTRPVLNGFLGWLYANSLFVFKWLWERFKLIFQPLYAIVRSTHLTHPFWKPTFTTLTLYTEEHGALIKTIYRGRTVARYWLRTGSYQCHKPFDLVLERPVRPSRAFDDEAPCHETR